MADDTKSHKNWVALFLLWLIELILFGCCGLHRCYQGGANIIIGILCCLTWGFCGIGWIVDGILLFTGNLKDGEGHPIPVDV